MRRIVNVLKLLANRVIVTNKQYKSLLKKAIIIKTNKITCHKHPTFHTLYTLSYNP